MKWTTQVVELLRDGSIPLSIISTTPFYKGNQYLRKPNIEYAYTSEERVELGHITSYQYFKENYWYLNGTQAVKLFACQEELLRNMRTNRFNLVAQSRQIGLSTVVALDIAHTLLTEDNKTIFLSSYKYDDCENIIAKVKAIYMSLPFALKKGIILWNAKSISFDNGSRVVCGNYKTAPNTDIDKAYLLDYCFAVNDNPKVTEKFYKGVIGALKANASLFIASTPTSDVFCKLYCDALHQKNNFKASKILWDEIPSRNDGTWWKDNQIKDLGSERDFEVEYELAYLTEYYDKYLGELTEKVAEVAEEKPREILTATEIYALIKKDVYDFVAFQLFTKHGLKVDAEALYASIVSTADIMPHSPLMNNVHILKNPVQDDILPHSPLMSNVENEADILKNILRNPVPDDRVTIEWVKKKLLNMDEDKNENPA